MEWLKKYIEQKKKEIKREREYRKEQKELERKDKKLDKELLKEIKEEEKIEREKRKKEKKFIERVLDYIFDFWQDVTDTKDEKELLEYMTESQKEEYLQDKKEEKRYSIVLGSFIAVFFVAIVAISLIAKQALATDWDKVTVPMFENYYKDTFGKKGTIENIDYVYLDEDSYNKKTKSDVIVATFDDGTHVLSYKDSNMGDDVNISTVYDDYNEFIKTKLGDISLFNTETQIMYTPYLVKYNYYYDYIKALPKNETFEKMYNESNLTIVSKISYSGNIDISSIQDVLSKLGSNSVYYLYESSGSNLASFSIVTKDNVTKYPIMQMKNIDSDVVLFDIDSSLNVATSVTSNKVSDVTTDESEYKYYNVRKLTVEQVTQSMDERNLERSEYYLIRIDPGYLEPDIVLLNDNFEEMDADNYPFVSEFETSSGVYVLAKDSMIIANKTKLEKSWLCEKFGKC